MKNALGNIMQQAQKMQEDLKKAQEELALMQVQGRIRRRFGDYRHDR